MADINFITNIFFLYFTDMFGKEAIKLITELDMHEDIRPFNVSIINIIPDNKMLGCRQTGSRFDQKMLAD